MGKLLIHLLIRFILVISLLIKEELGIHQNRQKTKIIDCSGKIITHGFCDIHSHFRAGRGYETLETGSLAAMAGGFTRVCVMPNTYKLIRQN